MRRLRLAALATAAVVPLSLLMAPSAAVAARRGFHTGSGAACGSLTATQAGDLAFVRDEERLALDLYTVFADEYPNSAIFSNIADAEQRHFDAVGGKIAKYCVLDPSAGMDPGEFVDHPGHPDLQALYNILEPQGLASLEGALEAGVTVEETDIHDISGIVAKENPADIEQVYNHLLDGSYSHLAAFNDQLDDLE